MLYLNEDLVEMGQKIDLLEYASKTVDFVKHTGDTYFAICPFHSEKTPSLAVNTERQFWKCFGCGKHGTIYNWIMLTENMTFPQAVQRVADLTNSNVNEICKSESKSFYKKLNEIYNNEHIAPSHTVLDIEKDYHEKYSDEVPQKWIDEGISQKVMKKYDIRIDHMSNRIVYPVFDNQDNLISIKGRTLFENYKTLKIMKYMMYYKVGAVDYFQGMQQARESINSLGEIIIVEGIKSVMKLDQWGYHNVVSAETSTLNDYQIELLVKMHIKDVVIAFDKDVPLRKIQECTRLLKKFVNCYAVIDKWGLLKDKDSPPDEGESVWRTLYERRVRL